MGDISLSDDPDLRIARMAAPMIMDLLTALLQDDGKALAGSLVRLLGYGIGGTPSGDDLMVGMLAALRRSRHPLAVHSLPQLCGTLKEHLTDKATSLLSLTVLHHALVGEFSEKIHAVTRQLMHPGDPEQLKSSLDRLLMHGATSGAEMFLGICLGFELIYFSTHDHSDHGG